MSMSADELYRATCAPAGGSVNGRRLTTPENTTPYPAQRRPVAASAAPVALDPSERRSAGRRSSAAAPAAQDATATGACQTTSALRLAARSTGSTPYATR